MSPFTQVFREVLYLVILDEKGEPSVVAQGRPADIPEEAYAEAKRNAGKNVGAQFPCQQCKELVFTFSLSDALVQLCRCQVVKHSCHATHGYSTSEEWSLFRKLHKEKSRNPVPDNPLRLDPFSGKPLELTEEGKAHMSRVQGFKRPVDWSPDGTLLKTHGGSSVFSNAENQVTSARIDSWEDAPDILHALRRQNPIPPPVIICVGDDPDYVFPPGAYDVQPLPFRCPHCRARVKRARLDSVHADRNDACLCMGVTYRRDTAGARSSKDWTGYRDLYFENLIRHQAAAADGQS